MDCFDKFDPLMGDVPLYPFFSLIHIASEARELLDGLSNDEIRWIEKDVDSTIEHVQDFFRKHAAGDDDLSDEEWGEYIDELSEVSLLRIAVDCGQMSSDPESPGYYHPDKNAAVLALMFVARCIETLECAEEDLGLADEGPIAARLIPAANEAIEAASALGLAQKYRFENEIVDDLTVHPTQNSKIIDSEISDEHIKAALSKSGRMGAAARLADDKRQHAKEQVKTKWDEWQTNPILYRNDSAFALTMLGDWNNVLKSQTVITGWCRAWRKKVQENVSMPPG